MKRINLFIWMTTSLLAGEGSLRVPHEMQGTEIIDKRGSRIPGDVKLINHEGKQVQVSDYLNQGKPVILTLGYYQCPMLCSLVLNALTEVMKGQSLKLGQDYHILSVSINPHEKVDLANAKRKNYLNSVFPLLKKGGQGGFESAWSFTVGKESEVKRLADAVGFGYKYHKPSGEYVHSAGIFILSPEGVLTRTIYGVSYQPSDFKMSLIEASHGKVGSLLDRVILSCFHYEPDSHRYGIYVFGVMRLAGLLTILVVGSVLFVFWKRERRLKAWTV